MAKLEAIVEAIRDHGHYASVQGDKVLATCRVYHMTLPPKMETTELATWREARDWLGY